MVDPIGSKRPAATERRVAPVVPSAAPTAEQPNHAATAASVGVSRALSQSAPVDVERVARIRKAIEDGRFPILPATIADRLIALKLDWRPTDEAS